MTLNDGCALDPLHGDLEILRGKTISQKQLKRLEDRWRRSDRMPSWLLRDRALADKVSAALAKGKVP